MTLTRILRRSTLFLCAFPLVSLACLGGRAVAAPLSVRVAVAGNDPAAPSARLMGRLPGAAPVSVTLTLPLRDSVGLEDLLDRLHDPADPVYGHYLTPAQFAARFSPTVTDYAAVAAFARAQGLTVTGTHANRLLLDVSGPAASVEAALGVRLNQYRASDGRVFRAPASAPSVPRALAGRLTGVAGLSDAAVRRPHNVRLSAGTALRPELAGRLAGGTGPGGGLTPSDIKAAYSLSGTSLTGAGQTLALFEQDGYDPADIGAYEARFGLRPVPLQNVLVDTATGAAGANADEVTLDIELQVALASGASKILVYETGSTDAEVLDAYSRIAEDDQAKQVSTSWGLDEPESAPATLQAENPLFQQMAAQGQTIYAASGDYGAYDTGSRSGGLTVDDPASQPYVCGVGGTTLTTSGPGGAYASETTWNSGAVANGAGGGGVSAVWTMPAWQQAAVSAATRGSATMRNVPDVSLNADPNTGYAIYTQGGWQVYGGTSCAAPLWAAFTALVNQQRAAGGLAPLGQAGPALYPLLTAARYAADFHDIADGSTNLYYPTVTGYDDATGLGTLNGASLLADLAPGITAHTRILWTNPDGRATLWYVNPDNSYGVLGAYGPYADGGGVWKAAAVATGPNGVSRILWTNPDGRATLWYVNPSGSYGVSGAYGPYADSGGVWKAGAVSVGPDNAAHILWTNPDGRATLWYVNPSGSYGVLGAYGPYTDNGGVWRAAAVATGPNGVSRLLWTNPDGRATLWYVNPDDSYGVTGAYGATTDSGGVWRAGALSIGPDNVAHILWTNPDGRTALWYINPNAGYGLVGAYAATVDGGGVWRAAAVATGPNGVSRLLWTNPDGRATLWFVNPSGSYGVSGAYGPYADGGGVWRAVADSAGP